MSTKMKNVLTVGPIHSVNKKDTEWFQKSLLKWYLENKRELPWRSIATYEEDANKRAYAVWVSEIMLQQTQVATVVNYFKRWMEKWPTLDSLAEATLEEVNEIWAGLGYYSRAKRLHEGAIKISQELERTFPQNRDSLQKLLPGVGRYTASAIASIAMKEVVGVVDGNVMRVLSRFRAIGGDITSQGVSEEMWRLADQLVDEEEPGDFNQALMELGATVCTPKNPSCQSCPIRGGCLSLAITERRKSNSSVSKTFKKAKNRSPKSLVDLEDCVPKCDLCLGTSDWNDSLGVQNFPRKGRKTVVKDKTTSVLILRDQKTLPNTFLCFQRPQNGLLANLWEFLSFPLANQDESAAGSEKSKINHKKKLLMEKLKNEFEFNESFSAKNFESVGDVKHIFSHIHQTYRVYIADVEGKTDFSTPERYQALKWMTEEEFLSSATSTAMKKVFKAYKTFAGCGEETEGKSRKRPLKAQHNEVDKKQTKLSQFFNPVDKIR